VSGEYLYKGRNLTALILTKTEHVVSLIATQESVPFERAYRGFVDSKTFQNLQNTQTLLWGESAEFIVDDYYLEVQARNRSAV